jgi:hypothetical protein
LLEVTDIDMKVGAIMGEFWENWELASMLHENKDFRKYMDDCSLSALKSEYSKQSATASTELFHALRKWK